MEYRDVVKKSEAWLLDHQDVENGGWPEQPGRQSNALNTAEALLALREVDQNPDLRRAMAVKRGVAFLVRMQLKAGEDAGAWGRLVQTDTAPVAYPDVIRTAFAVQAIVRSAPGDHLDCIQAAVEWLAKARNAQELWSFGGRKDGPTSLVASTCAIEALIDACRGSEVDCERAATATLATFVRALRQMDDSFGREGRLQAVHTLHAALLLQKARKCTIPVAEGAEDAALEWILGQPPEDTLRMVEEQVELDEGSPVANYGFLYATDTMTIRLLAEIKDKSKDREKVNHLYQEAVNSVAARRATDGGFYGQRVLSWSTARAMSALWAARDFEPAPKKMPPPPPPPLAMRTPPPPPPPSAVPPGEDGAKAKLGPYVFAALVVEVIGLLVAVGLGAGEWVGVVLIVLMVLTLVGYGVMSESGASKFMRSVFGRQDRS